MLRAPLRSSARVFWRHNSTVPLFQPIHPLLLKRAENLGQEFSKVQELMSQSSYDQDLTIKFSNLSRTLEHYSQYKQDMDSYRMLREMMDEETDEELLKDAHQEMHELIPRLTRSITRLQKRLIPAVKHDDKAAILELRPGIGGSEAALFMQDMLNLYMNFASHMKWPAEFLSGLETDTEAIISIDAPGAYNLLRFESGVHRVQRIPATESKGRIHTSTAAVVVLPKISDGTERSLKEDERQFAPGEIRIDTMRAGGKGGQHVNTTDSAVRLVHIPTGMMVMQQDERSQPKNKAKAFSILRARLAQLDRDKEIAEQKRLRTDQVSSTDRSDKIRTYNYPQNRVTDHRCGHSIHDLAGFMSGAKLEEMIEKLEEAEFEERLEALIASE